MNLGTHFSTCVFFSTTLRINNLEEGKQFLCMNKNQQFVKNKKKKCQLNLLMIKNVKIAAKTNKIKEIL